MTKSGKTLRILRIASGFSAFLYLIFGLLLEPVLGIDDMIPLTHRLFLAAGFGGLLVLSYIFSVVRKHVGILFYALAVGAIFNLVFLGVQEGYDAGAIVALLLVIPVMNFLFYRWKALLYANIMLLLGIIGSFIISSPSPLNLLLFIFSSIAISGASLWGARRLLLTEQRAEKSEKLYTNLFHNSLEGIALHEMILSDKGKPVDYVFLEANAAFEAHTGLRLENVLGKKATEVFPGKGDANSIVTYARVVLTGQSVVFEHFSDFLQRFYRVAAYAVGEKQFVTVFEDITERKKAEKQALYLSFHDQLTGLYNRRFYEEELKRIDTPRNLPISMVLADLNDLKLTNDAFGHQVGDELLKAVSGVLKKACRKDEIVARIGGDEFVILLPKTDFQSAEKLVNRIQAEISNKEVGGINLSVSFGWHTKNRQNELFRDVFKQAEDMMYKQKILGVNSHKFKAIEFINKNFFEKYEGERIHAERVSQYSKKIGMALGLCGEDLNNLHLAGLYHDIGKIEIGKSTSNKQGKLSETELNAIKRHPNSGYLILSSVNEFTGIAEIVLAHHERLDGMGYPQGLKADGIPKMAKIIAVADAFDNIFKSGDLTKETSMKYAISELKKGAGNQFDESILRVFAEKVLGVKWR